MVAFPLSILALAAGVYLLVKVNKEYLNGFFEILAWLVILLSLVSIGFVAARGINHFRNGHGGCHGNMGGMRQEQIIIRESGSDSGCVYKNIKIGETDCCKMHGMGGGKMEGMEECPMMKGDSAMKDCCKKK